MDQKKENIERRFTLRKGEKLRHRQLVGRLFEQGKSMYEYPLRLTWNIMSREEMAGAFRDAMPKLIDSVQMLITVPKKKRRRAVDRVLLRRRIREAYRLNRLPLIEAVEKNSSIGYLQMAFIYLSDQNADYAEIEKKMKSLLTRLEKKCAKS